ncbi:MAG: hypothetical protein ACHP7D_10520 [Lysobacterales bacterium]
MDDGVVQTALSRARLKRALHVCGAILCLLAVALLLRRGLALGDALGESLTRIAPAAFAAALGLYVGASLLLGLVWCLLVRMVADARPRFRPLFAAHLRAQLAKYLPGNVFHLAYRHLATRGEGVGHRALVLALALESVFVVAAAAILALGVASDPRLDALTPHVHQLIWAAPLLALVAWIGVTIGARRWRAGRSARGVAASAAAALAIDIVFFILAGCALRLLSEHPAALPIEAWLGWLALAWAAGYVTPGAPAGLGLREAVLVLALAPPLGDADALAIVLAYRLLTLMADGILALTGFVLSRDRSAVGSAPPARS